MKKRSRLLGMCGALGILMTGCSWGMESLSPRSQEMIELRRSVVLNESHCTYDAYIEGWEESDLEKACELLETAILGTGESEFSKKIRKIVQNDIKTFSDAMKTIPAFSHQAKVFFNENIDSKFISSFAFCKCFSPLGSRLLKLAEQKLSKGNKDEAREIKNKAVFWLFFHNLDAANARKVRKIEESLHE